MKMRVRGAKVSFAGEGELSAFPDEVLAQTQAESLDLYGIFHWNKRIRIPNGIARLGRRRRLQIGMANIQELPEAIGKLPHTA